MSVKEALTGGVVMKSSQKVLFGVAVLGLAAAGYFALTGWPPVGDGAQPTLVDQPGDGSQRDGDSNHRPGAETSLAWLIRVAHRGSRHRDKRFGRGSGEEPGHGRLPLALTTRVSSPAWATLSKPAKRLTI